MDKRIEAALERRRERLAAAWDLNDELALVFAGEPIGIPGGADQQYPFRAHPEYFYLTDRNQPGGVLAFDSQDGWRDFTPQVSEAERVWEGRGESDGEPLTLLEGWLAARRGRPLITLGAGPAAIRSDPQGTKRLRDALTHVRRPKDDVELERIRASVAATAGGFEAARRFIRAGVSEREIQIELEAGFFRAGADATAYSTIVGVGTNAAVLHFTPTARRAREGDLALIDAGAETRRYAADVTRTYSVGALSGARRELYEIVLSAQVRAVEACVVGAEWRDVHLRAALDLAEGLAQMGVLRGAADALVEQDAHALFFPHGIGHMLGLGVRDAGGYLAGRKRSTRPGLSTLRMDLPLEAGYVVTVEPGLYFIPALLNDPARRDKHADAVHWGKVDSLLDIGGVRIEDNVLVTPEGPQTLTSAISKRVDRSSE